MARCVPTITIPDLSGRLAVVTGGSDGLGLLIAGRLAAAGAEAILPVRNQGKGAAVVAQIKATTPEAAVTTRDLDLSSLDSVRELSAGLIAEGRPINVLINNAGVMNPPSRQMTRDGFELQYGTNHLGHFALTGHLMPLLQQGHARVTTQTSISAGYNAINWDDLQWEKRWNSDRAYSQSKISNLQFALELNRRSEALGWGITSNASHPGIALTSLLAARPELGRTHNTLINRVVRRTAKYGIISQTAAGGSLPALYAATHHQARRGALYGPSGPLHPAGAPTEQKPYRASLKPGEAERTWTVAERLTGVSFPAMYQPAPR